MTGLLEKEIKPGRGQLFSSCQIVRIAAGKAKSMKQYFDMMTMLQQLGLAS